MAYADWTADLGLGTYTIPLNSSTPIVSSQSVDLNAATAGSAACAITASNTLPRGYLTGVYRTLMRLNNSTANSSSIRVGIVIMASASNIPFTNGNFYTVVKNGSVIALRRGNTATLSGGGTLLTSASHSVSTSTVFSLQVEWDNNVSRTGGAYFRISTGSATDYSDLVTLFEYTDNSSSRLTSSVTEGLTSAGSGTPASSTTFDRTELLA